MARQQIDGLRAAAYDRSETLTSEVVVLNKTSALYTAEFSRQRADGSEIARLGASYLLAAGSPGLRICTLAVRTS